MKKCSCLLLIFLSINNLLSFIQAQKLPKPKYSYDFFKKAKTTDMLYLNDTVLYLMTKSPLEVFSGYKNLYASYKEIHPVEISVPIISQLPPSDKTTYQVIWVLKDSNLYLTDISFYSIDFCNYKSVFPNNEQYKLMEKLTKVKFDEKYPIPSGNPPLTFHNSIGMMPAKWFNDTILIKISASQYLGGQGKELPIYCSDANDTIWIKRPAQTMEVDKWLKIPSEELVFKNGKLISRKVTDIY
ncbi:MAG: hypothetical protein VB079_04485 [Petrimonas sp.]|jgi:hypothetical protein|nr:hypothetical protein [Petrimonas sp.]